MDCGDAGHILVLTPDGGGSGTLCPLAIAHLHDLGECEVKHGARVHIFNLYTDGLGNPEVTPKIKAQRRKVSRCHPNKRWLALAAAILVLALLAWWWRSHHSNPVSERSIAVLPFANLSRDPDNAYFAVGIQDELLTHLAKLGALKVISRTSTPAVLSAPWKSARDRAATRVAHILEGSVQRMRGSPAHQCAAHSGRDR